MRGFARLLVTLAAGAVVLSGQARAAPASDPAPAQFTVNECPPGAGAANEAEDQRLVDNAFAAMGTSGFPGITIYLPRLRAAMDRAPACYPMIERVDGRILVRSADSQEYLTISGAIASALPAGQHADIAQASNTYIQVSFILGSYANEMQHYDEGLAFLDRGLALQPHLRHYWQRIAAHVSPRHRAGRLKQWLNLLRRRFPEAQAAFDTVRTFNDPLVVEALLFGVAASRAAALRDDAAALTGVAS